MNIPAENLVLVIGWPGSNITGLARAVSAHSRVDAFSGLLDARTEGSLLMTLNAAEPPTVDRALQQLDRATAAGIRTGLVFLVKSPLTRLAELLDGIPPAEHAEHADAFWSSTRSVLQSISVSAPRFARRLVFQDRLAREPALELARVMALFPYPVESPQLDMELDVDGDRAADERQIETLMAAPVTPAVAHMARVHELIQSRTNATHYDDRLLLEELWLAVDRLTA